MIKIRLSCKNETVALSAISAMELLNIFVFTIRLNLIWIEVDGCTINVIS